MNSLLKKLGFTNVRVMEEAFSPGRAEAVWRFKLFIFYVILLVGI